MGQYNKNRAMLHELFFLAARIIFSCCMNYFLLQHELFSLAA